MKLIKTLLVVACISLPLGAMAQPGFGDDTSDTPFDGGVSMLVIGGIGYGVKKLQERKRQLQSDKNNDDQVEK